VLDADGPEALGAALAQLGDGHFAASVVYAALDVGLLDGVATPRTAADLAAALGVNEDGITRLANATVALGLTVLHGGRYAAKPALVALLASPAASELRFRASFLAPLLGRLGAASRTASPQHAAWSFAEVPPAVHPYDELSKHPARYRTFLEAMDEAASGVGAALAAVLGLRSGDVVVDAGCGGGMVARELLHAVPGLRVRSFDLGPGAEIARERSARAGLAERHEIVVADIRERWPFEGADVALLSAVLADFERPAQAVILRNARAATRSGGRLVVSEQLLDASETGPPNVALLSLVLLAGTAGGRQLTLGRLDHLFAEVGLERSLHARAGSRDVCVAGTP